MTIVGLLVALFICYAAAASGSLFTTSALPRWYASLRKPAWNPPNWVFAPVWAALYTMMGVAVWVVWARAGFGGASLAIALFTIQLVLNIAWSALFFALRNPSAAFADIVALWLAIAATCAAFAQISVLAGLLLVPYLAWVSFALVLNFSIMRRNLVTTTHGS